MRLAGRGDLVQRAAHQPAAEHRVDLRLAERQGGRTVGEAGGLFKAAQTLAKFLEHRYKPLTLRRDFSRTRVARPLSANAYVLYLF